MSPFTSFLYSRSKAARSKEMASLNDDSKVGGDDQESCRWKIIQPKKAIASVAQSLPTPRSSLAVGAENNRAPEEGVFSMDSLGMNLSRSIDWECIDYYEICSISSLFETSCLTESNRFMSSLELDHDHETTIPVTPARSVLVGSKCQDAPARLKLGRGKFLERYIHNYECEDYMEYAVDLYAWKKSLEFAYQPGSWIGIQVEVTVCMRVTLLEWMVDVSRSLEFSLETWCLGVNYLDRFLCVQPISKDCLQLAGLSALWLGAKQGELSPPCIFELIALCSDSYTATNFKHFELIMLAKLKFNLAAPTVAFFMNNLVVVEEERDWSWDLSRHLVEMVLQDQDFAQMRPSKVAYVIFSILKACDRTALHLLEGSCPKCEPYSSDEWCYDYFYSCYARVTDELNSLKWDG